MNYHNILHNDMLNGEGLRVVLFVSGCNHQCKGCQNPQTWNKCSGIPFDLNAYMELEDALNKDYISGLTLSGGDPLFPDNRYDIYHLVKQIKETFPNKTIWCYTGYRFEDVKDLDILHYIDVLVDGEFDQECRELDSVKPKWRGSRNQRIIDVQKSLKSETVEQIWKYTL